LRIRRRRIVEGFQLQLVLTLLVWLVACVFLFAAALIGPFVWTLNSGQAGAMTNEAAVALLALHRRVWPPLAGLLIAQGLVYLALSHRIAGPLYRFRRIFRQVTETGDLVERVRIRRRDYLAHEATELDGMLTAIRDRIRSAQQAAHLTRITAEQLGTGAAGPASGARRLVDQAAETERRLAWFVTEPAPTTTAAPGPRRTDAGFSVVELLIVMSIVSSLAALGVPAYQSALDRARVTRAVGDVSAVAKEITMFHLNRGCYPGSLADIGRSALVDPWQHTYVYQVPQGPGSGRHGGSCQACQGACVLAGVARKDKNLVPINSDFDLFSKGKDGLSAAALTAGSSQDDIIRARDGGFVGLASSY
jgi:general secretion pathway protein G